MSHPHDQTAPRLAAKPLDSNGSESAKARKRVEAPQHPVVRKRLADMPDSARRGYLRAIQGKASPRAAIKMFCTECCGWQRNEVRLCTAQACPLYAYRPFQGGRA